MKDAFSALHPAVSFTYFAAVIVFGMFLCIPCSYAELCERDDLFHLSQRAESGPL